MPRFKIKPFNSGIRIVLFKRTLNSSSGGGSDCSFRISVILLIASTASIRSPARRGCCVLVISFIVSAVSISAWSSIASRLSSIADICPRNNLWCEYLWIVIFSCGGFGGPPPRKFRNMKCSRSDSMPT